MLIRLALVGFVAGAAFGAFCMQLVGFWSIFLPAIATTLLALDTQRYELNPPIHKNEW